MALKDIWVDLKDSTTGVDGNDASAEDINEIAHAVIKNEEDIEEIKKSGSGTQITIDEEMSDTSKNAVQNRVIKAYVDEMVGDVETVLNELHVYAQSLISGGGI